MTQRNPFMRYRKFTSLFIAVAVILVLCLKVLTNGQVIPIPIPIPSPSPSPFVPPPPLPPVPTQPTSTEAMNMDWLVSTATTISTSSSSVSGNTMQVGGSISIYVDRVTNVLVQDTVVKENAVPVGAIDMDIDLNGNAYFLGQTPLGSFIICGQMLNFTMAVNYFVCAVSGRGDYLWVKQLSQSTALTLNTISVGVLSGSGASSDVMIYVGGTQYSSTTSVYNCYVERINGSDPINAPQLVFSDVFSAANCQVADLVIVGQNVIALGGEEARTLVLFSLDGISLNQDWMSTITGTRFSMTFNSTNAPILKYSGSGVVYIAGQAMNAVDTYSAAIYYALVMINVGDVWSSQQPSGFTRFYFDSASLSDSRVTAMTKSKSLGRMLAIVNIPGSSSINFIEMILDANDIPTGLFLNPTITYVYSNLIISDVCYENNILTLVGLAQGGLSIFGSTIQFSTRPMGSFILSIDKTLTPTSRTPIIYSGRDVSGSSPKIRRYNDNIIVMGNIATKNVTQELPIGDQPIFLSSLKASLVSLKITLDYSFPDFTFQGDTTYVFARSLTLNGAYTQVNNGATLLLYPNTVITIDCQLNMTTQDPNSSNRTIIGSTDPSNNVGQIVVGAGRTVALNNVDILLSHPQKTIDLGSQAQLFANDIYMAPSSTHISGLSIFTAKIRNSTFDSTTMDSIVLAVSVVAPTLSIWNNLFISSSGKTLTIQSVSGVDVSQNHILNSFGGLVISMNSNATIQSNVFEGCQQLILLDSVTSNSPVFHSISWNRFFNNSITQKGINLNIEKASLVFNQNQFQNNVVSTSPFMYFESSSENSIIFISNNEVRNNTLTFAGGIELLKAQCYSSKKYQIIGNIFSGNTYPISSTLVSLYGTMQIQNNTFQSAPLILQVGSSSTVNAQFNYWGVDTMQVSQVPQAIYRGEDTSFEYIPIRSTADPQSALIWNDSASSLNVTMKSRDLQFCEDLAFSIAVLQSLQSIHVTWRLEHSIDGLLISNSSDFSSDPTKITVPRSVIPQTGQFTLTTAIFGQSNQVSQNFTRRQPSNAISLSVSGLDKVIYGFKFNITATVGSIPTCIVDQPKLWMIGGSAMNAITQSGNNYSFELFSNQTTGQRSVSIQLYIGDQITTTAFSFNVIAPTIDIVASKSNVRQQEVSILKPEELYLSSYNIAFVWTCAQCESFPVSSNKSVSFKENKIGDYEIKMQYSFMQDTMTSWRNTTSMIIRVSANPDIPVVQIANKLSLLLVSAQKKLSIEADITLTNRTAAIFVWTVSKSDGNSIFKKQSATYSPLTLPEGTLSIQQNYTVGLTVMNLGYVSTDSVILRTGSLPSISNFTISPNNGVALDTLFTLSATMDNSTASSIQYSYYLWNPQLSVYEPLNLFSTSGLLNTKLPRGYDRNLLEVRCVVEDVLGSTASRSLNISVSAPTMESVQNTLTSLSTNYSASLMNTITTSIVQEIESNQNSVSNMTTIIRDVVGIISNELEKERNRTGSLSLSSITSGIFNFERLTQNTSYITPTTGVSALKSINTIMDVVMDNSTIRLEGQYQRIASSISNIQLSFNQNSSVIINDTVSSLGRLSSIIISEKLLSEPATIIQTQFVEMIIKVDIAEQIANSSFSTNASQVMLPEAISEKMTPNERYAVEMMSFGGANHPFSWSQASQNLSSSVVSFRIVSNNTKVAVQNLSSPIEIVIQKKQYDSLMNGKYRYDCRYWDETTDNSWDVSGCYLFSETSSEVVCHCNHTTSFSAFIIYDPKQPNKASDGLYITSIVVYSILAIFSLSLLIFIAIYRNKQPIQSRFLAPYIGLSAIIVECILNGIIRNSLLINASTNKEFRGVNSIAYIIISISNPIVLVSLFVYFWQMARYLFMKNLYAFMDVENPNHIKMRMLKLLSSKLVYIFLAISIMVLSCIYYVLFSIAESTNAIKASSATTLNAVSFASMSVVIAILILSLFFWDLSFVLSRKVFHRTSDMVNKNADAKSVELESVKAVGSILYNHFTVDDPLQFRVESIFMTFAMLLMVVSYIVGISDRFNKNAKPNSAAKIIEFLFDLAYIAMRIISFGGYIVLVRLIHRFKFHSEHEKYESLKTYVNDLKSGSTVSTVEQELMQLLKNEYGFKAISNYAKKEFSLENILLWKELELARSSNMVSSNQQRMEDLKRIQEMYIQSGSTYEINLPAKSKKKFEAALRSENLSASESEEVLLSIYNEIMINICDTYTRFATTQEFQRFTDLSKVAVELMDV